MSTPEEMELNLLLFSVGGVQFGVDAGQVAEMHAYGGEREEDLFWFHEEIPLGDHGGTYRSPTVISIRTTDDRPYRVIIDLMEDIGTFGPGDIRLFPALVEPFVRQNGMWGILPRDGKLVLLVDFTRLTKNRPDGSPKERPEPEETLTHDATVVF